MPLIGLPETSPDLTPSKHHRKRSTFLSSILWGVVVFAMHLTLAEGAFNIEEVQDHFLLRSVGSYHAQFEIKWFKLEDYVKANGGVDVIILGSSMVNTGIDPVYVARQYRSITGQRVRVFNFGVEGLTIAPLSRLAQILKDRYHPAAIIVYTEMRDYVEENQNSTEVQFLENPWIRQQLGAPSLESTLIENSQLLQHILPLRGWQRSDFMDTYFMNLRRMKETTSMGYEADLSIDTSLSFMESPDPNDPEQKKKFELYADFTIAEDRKQDLVNILSLQDENTRVIVTEIPVYPTYYTYFGGESVHSQYEKDLAAIVTKAGGVFIPAFSYSLIPIRGRADNHHLNYLGAPIYSRALGDRLGTLCEEEVICLTVGGSDLP